MVENLNDLQIFVKRIEKEYGGRIAYRYLADDSIIDKTFAELAKDIHTMNCYPTIKSWFLETYPEIVKFGNKEEKPKILQIGEKRAS